MKLKSSPVFIHFSLTHTFDLFLLQPEKNKQNSLVYEMKEGKVHCYSMCTSFRAQKFGEVHIGWMKENDK